MNHLTSILNYFLFYLVITYLSPISIFAQSSDWSEAKRKNGIVVKLREYEGSDVKEFLGTVEIESTQSQVFSLLSDVDSCKYLYFNCKELQVLSQGIKKSIVYIRNGAPWPVSDRDVIVERIADQNEKTKTVTIKLKKIEYPTKPPPSGVTRMDRFEAVWKISSSDGKKIRIEYQAHFEPGGSIPQSVINLAITDTPMNTMLNLQKAIEEGKFKDTRVEWIKD